MSEAPLTFYRSEDFKVTVGKDKKELTIPRISFTDGKKVIDIISGLMVEGSSYQLKSAAKIHQASLLLNQKSFDAYADFIKMSLPFLNELQSYGMVIELMTAISSDVLDEKKAKEYGMQYREVIDLVAYLLDENFATLKNLLASLEAIAVSVKPPSK